MNEKTDGLPNPKREQGLFLVDILTLKDAFCRCVLLWILTEDKLFKRRSHFNIGTSLPYSVELRPDRLQEVARTDEPHLQRLLSFFNVNQQMDR